MSEVAIMKEKKIIVLLPIFILLLGVGCKSDPVSGDSHTSYQSGDSSTIGDSLTSGVTPTSDPYISEDLTPYWVTFVTNTTQTLERVYTGVIREMPVVDNPGYSLVGWYLEASFVNVVSFPYYVKSDVTLYAKWSKGEESQFTFKHSDTFGGYVVTSYGANDINVVIPSTFNNKPVVAIGEQVFYRNGAIVSVVLPASIKNIGLQAFKDANSLEELILPSAVTRIETDAFAGTTSLTSVTLSTNLEYIGNNAFEGSALSEVVIPAKVSEINARAFASISTLTKVTLEPIIPPLRFHTSFEGTNNNLKYYVNSQVLNDYKTNDHWKDYASIIFAKPS